MADPAAFPTCTHTNNCACGGEPHSYKKSYKQVLDIVRPVFVFEWGPGPNSIMAMDMPECKYVVSVEQDKKWIPDLNNDKHAVIHTRTSSPMYPSLFGCENFDIFFIDSRRRGDCIYRVYMDCKDSAVICLHDAQRKRYHADLARF